MADPRTPLLAVSVDVDPLSCYTSIHALPEKPELAPPDPIFTVAVPRLVALFQQLQIPATFFLVGQSVTTDPGRTAAAALAEAGFELGNHSHTHPYALGRLSAAEVAAEFEAAHEAIAAAGQVAPVGFRAPGYALSPHLGAALSAAGYLYDASLLPSPPYYGAKAAVLAKMRLAGKRSGSSLGHAAMMWGPRTCYRPSDRFLWRRGSAPFVEIPMACTRWLRLPVIGTSLVLAPGWLRRAMLQSIRTLPVVSLELHAIDLLDGTAPGMPPSLAGHQPDLRLPWQRKQEILAQSIEQLRSGRQTTSLAEAARQLL